MFKKLLYTCSLALGLLFTGCAEDDWLRAPGSDVPDRDYAEIELAVAAPQTVRTRAGYNIEDSRISNATVLIYKVGDKFETSTFLQGETFLPPGGTRDLKSIKIAYNDAVKTYCRASSSAQVYFFVVANHTFSNGADGKPAYPQTVQALRELKDAISAANIPNRTTVTMTGIALNKGTDADSWKPAETSAAIQPVSKATLNQTVTVKMTRDIARAHVINGAGGFDLIEYSIWSAAPEAYVIGGLTGDVSTAGMGQNPSNGPTFPKTTEESSACWQVPSDDSTKPNFVYAYGQKEVEDAKLGDDNRAFVIIKGEYKNQTCYYRVDFRKEKPRTDAEIQAGKSPEYDYFYLTPNHEYEITIEQVKAKGYDSAAEAAMHPQQDFLEVTIHDHVPAVLSMTSDGQRELGVESPVQFGSTDASSTDASKKGTFTMKLLSYHSDTDYPSSMTVSADGKKITGDNFSAEVTKGSEWLHLYAPVDRGSADIVETGESTSDNGKIYKVGVESVSSISAGTLEGQVTVKWRGLERVVDVKWVNTFDLSKVMDAKVSMDYNGTSKSITNYWTFLDNSTNAVSTSKLCGAGEKENDGNIRNEGIHLPLGIGGTKADKYKMTYTLTMKGEYASKKISAKIVSDLDGSSIVFPQNCFKVKSGTSSTDPSTITITVDASSFGNQYFTGKLRITASDADGSNAVALPEIDVYHTGFFWYVDSNDNALKYAEVNKPTAGWYYYEVRSYGGRMWLDRNVGATSGGMAIIYKDGSTAKQLFETNSEEFNHGAVGAYYKPTEEVTDKKVEEHIKDDICPPGFRIPKTNEWDEIRNSYAFKNTQTAAGGVTYYQSSIEDDFGNEIYFPKAMYYNSSNLVGDSRAGYYWTGSEAAGMEKDEIGQWLQALVMSGGANSYMHGSIKNYKMQIRPVEDRTETVPKYTIGFKVKGATNVYIYDAREPFPYTKDESEGSDYRDYNDDIKSGLMQWPGIAIGEASTMSSYYRNGNYYKATTGTDMATEYVFTYTTTTNPKYLRFVFTYVENGRIYVFSRNDKGTGSGALKYNGWPLLDSYYFGFESKTANPPTYHYETGGTVSVETRTDATYKFFFKAKPKVGQNDPDAWPRGGVVQTLFGDDMIQINADWDDSRWQKVANTAGDIYYVYTLTTKEIDWNWRFNWRYNENGVTTYSAVGGPTQGTVQNYSLFKKDSNWGNAYCVTIDELHKAKAGSPGAPGSIVDDDSRSYRIYFPKSSTQMSMWLAKSSNNEYLVGPQNSGLANWSSGSFETYFYKNFSHTGDENVTIKFSRGGSNNDKTLNLTLSQFVEVDGVYSAYIDESNVGHAGKPEGVKEKDYVIYWPQTYGQMYLWPEGLDALITTTDTPDGVTGDYKYKSFKHKGDEDVTLWYAVGMDNNKNTGITLGDFVEDSDGKFYAYLDESYKGHAGKPNLTDDRTTYRVYFLLVSDKQWINGLNIRRENNSIVVVDQNYTNRNDADYQTTSNTTYSGKYVACKNEFKTKWKPNSGNEKDISSRLSYFEFKIKSTDFGTFKLRRRCNTEWDEDDNKIFGYQKEMSITTSNFQDDGSGVMCMYYWDNQLYHKGVPVANSTQFVDAEASWNQIF